MTNHALISLRIGQARIWDVRSRFPPQPQTALGLPRDMDALLGIAIHHDGVLFPAGDRDFSGSTLDEDLERLQAIYQHGLDQGWGGFPYHMVASSNGRTFYTTAAGLWGAHVALRNDELLGLCLMGNFETATPLQPQLCAAGLGLVALWHLVGRLRDVRGHREWALRESPTACPGDSWWRWQNGLMAAARAQGRLAFPTP